MRKALSSESALTMADPSATRACDIVELGFRVVPLIFQPGLLGNAVATREPCSIVSLRDGGVILARYGRLT
jgi:hypothetical protein